MINELHHRMYLLAHDAAARGPYDRSRTELLVRAAALVELALRGRLVEDGGVPTVSGTGPTGDPVLDEILREAPGHGWKHLVRHRRKRTLADVEDRLAAAGVLAVEASRTGFGGRRVTVAEPTALHTLRSRLFEALHGDGPADSIPVADAALLALTAAGGIRSVVPRRDQRALQARIDACTACLAALAPGLEKAVHGLPMTMIAAQGGMGGS